MAPSTTGRCGPKGGPIGPFTGGSNGSIRAHVSSVNTAVRDMHARSRPQHGQLVRHALAGEAVDGTTVPGPPLLVVTVRMPGFLAHGLSHALAECTWVCEPVEASGRISWQQYAC